MKKLFFISLILLSCATLYAQDTKVTTGVVAYDQGDYDRAVDALETGLSDLSSVKSKNIPKGFYYYGKALIGQFQQAVMNKDNAKAEQLTGNLMKAHEAFKSAKQYDDGKWGDKVDAELQLLFSSFLQGGLQALNTSYSATGSQKNELLESAKQYCKICTDINPNSYMSYDLLGQAELGLGDSTNAYKSFAMAGQKFQENQPDNPDVLIGYVYYRLALIDRYKNNDVDAALGSVAMGKKLVEQEWARMQDKLVNYTAQQQTALSTQYNSTIGDLSRFELDLLLNAPNKLQEALNKFEKAIKEEPTSYTIHIAYAQLLEKSDQEKAIVMYQKAIEIDPNNYHAYFNLGALYNNIASEYYKQANEITDYESAKPIEDKALEYLEKAYPQFQKADVIAPNDPTVLRALMQIAINLGKNDDYKRYKDALSAAQGN